MPFTDVFASRFWLAPKVCILAPGPNGRGRYSKIPSDYSIIAVSKAVLVPEINPAVWMMNHIDQGWYREANLIFKGTRIFAYDAAMTAQASLMYEQNCYYFRPPANDFLEAEVRIPVDGVIRFGATVSACAIQLAYNFGARDILLCGVDMAGNLYFDGDVNVHPHHGETWPAVARLNPLLKWLSEEQGLRVSTLSPTRLEVPLYKPLT